MHSRRSRIAIISHTLPPESNGQAVVLDRLLRDLDPDSYCLFSHMSVDSCDLRGELVRIPQFINLGWFRPVRKLMRLAEQLVIIFCWMFFISKKVKAKRCEAIVACTGEFFELPGSFLAARRSGVPFHVYMFDWYAYKYECIRGPAGWLTRLFVRTIEGFLLRRAESVVVPNETLASVLKARYGITPCLVRNATDLDPDPNLSSVDAMSGLSVRSNLVIRYTGALYQAHFDTLRRLKDALSYPGLEHVRVEIYTESPRDLLARRGIVHDRITVHSRVPTNMIKQLQEEADILFLPLAFASSFPHIITTSAPGKLGDYLASGTPILVHAPDNCFLADFTRKNHCGVVVGKADVSELAAAIRTLATDGELRDVLSRNGREIAKEEFSIEVNQKRLCSAIGLQARLVPVPYPPTHDLPKVSVVIPTYNRGEFVGKAIASVIEQDYPNVEVIVVDDGSTDNTEDVVTAFDSRVKYLRQERGGASRARNLGLKNVSGEFVAFLDSDDLFKPFKLELQARYLLTHPATALVSSWFEIEDEKGNVSESRVRLPKNGAQGLLTKVMHMPCATPTVMFRASLLKEVGEFDVSMRFAEDQDFFCRIGKLGDIAILPFALSTVCKHEGNITRTMPHEEVLGNWLTILDREVKGNKQLSFLSRWRAYGDVYFAAWSISRSNTGSKFGAVHLLARSVRCWPFRPGRWIRLLKSYPRMAVATIVRTLSSGSSKPRDLGEVAPEEDNQPTKTSVKSRRAA